MVILPISSAEKYHATTGTDIRPNNADKTGPNAKDAIFLGVKEHHAITVVVFGMLLLS